MDQRIGWLALGLALGVGLVACSSKVMITAESTTSGTSSAQGTSSGHPGGTGGMSGSGSSAQGSSSGSPGGTGGMSSASASSGTGAAGPGSGKVVTADNDIGQYASFTLMPTSTSNTEQKVVAGPFFVTDVYGLCELDTVAGGDCSVPQTGHTTVLDTTGIQYSLSQFHGMKLPVLSGQTLCTIVKGESNCTILGFKPY